MRQVVPAQHLKKLEAHSGVSGTFATRLLTTDLRKDSLLLLIL